MKLILLLLALTFLAAPIFAQGDDFVIPDPIQVYTDCLAQCTELGINILLVPACAVLCVANYYLNARNDIPEKLKKNPFFNPSCPSKGVLAEKKHFLRING